MFKTDIRRLAQYTEHEEIFTKHNCELLTTFDELKGKRITKTPVSYKTECGHETTITMVAFTNDPIQYKIRYNCFTYNKYVKLFKDRNCKLLYSLDEFIILLNNNDLNIRETTVKYIAQCLHENEMIIHSFDTGSGNICNTCVKIEQKTRCGDNRSFIIEDKGIVYIKKLFKDFFEIRLTDDGCLADFAIRNINSKEDLWLPIQLKTTKSNKYSYIFKLHKNKYINCIILCLCENEEKLWILNGNEVNETESLHINKSNTCKYSFEEIIKNNLQNSIVKYYNIMQIKQFDELNIPISLEVQKEQEFRKYRENKCNFITFEYPDETGAVYDFTINNLKVQEKTSYIVKSALRTHISRQTVNGVRMPSYKKNDNQFYWVHFPCKKYFLLFPEIFLINEGFIQTDNQLGKTTFYISVISIHDKDYKYNKYLFDYNNIDKEKLLKMIIIAEIELLKKNNTINLLNQFSENDEENNTVDLSNQFDEKNVSEETIE